MVALSGRGRLIPIVGRKQTTRQGQAVYFEVVGKIQVIETIAVGGRIREIMRLRKQYGARSLKSRVCCVHR